MSTCILWHWSAKLRRLGMTWTAVSSDFKQFKVRQHLQTSLKCHGPHWARHISKMDSRLRVIFARNTWQCQNSVAPKYRVLLPEANGNHIDRSLTRSLSQRAKLPQWSVGSSGQLNSPPCLCPQGVAWPRPQAHPRSCSGQRCTKSHRSRSGHTVPRSEKEFEVNRHHSIRKDKK